MKRITMIALTVVLALTMSVTSAFASTEIKVYLNDAQMSFDGTQPQMIDSSVYVPGRAIFEYECMTIQWDQATKTVYACTEGYHCMEFKVGSKTVKSYSIVPDEGNYDGLFKDMTVTSAKTSSTIEKEVKLINGRVLFPLRALSQFFGLGVMWDGVNRAVYLQDSTDYTNPSIETAPVVTDENPTDWSATEYYDYDAEITKPYDLNDITLKVGDKFAKYSFDEDSFYTFIGNIVSIDAPNNKVKVHWYDVECVDQYSGMGDLGSILKELKDVPMIFAELQIESGITFYQDQWIYAEDGEKL